MKSPLKICVVFSVVALTWMSSGTAHAQWFAPGFGYGAGWGSAQTPMSANAMGMSQVIRSQGEYNLLSAQAATYYEQARSQYMDNQQKGYDYRRSITRAARAQKAEERDAALAGLARADEFMASHQPLPLANSDLHPSTGKLTWPTALMAPEFNNSRQELETMFANKAKYGATANLVTQIDKKANEMKDQLREKITMMPLTDYSQARKFLDSLIASAK